MTTGTKVVFSVTRNHSAEICYKSLKVQVILKKKRAILADLDITLTNCQFNLSSVWTFNLKSATLLLHVLYCMT